jgi:hypothetical protein
MSTLDKKYYHNIDLDSNELKSGRIYNLDTTQRTGLALNTTHKGYIVYDITALSLYIWNGTAWTTAAGGSGDRKSTRLNSSHYALYKASRMPSSA